MVKTEIILNGTKLDVSESIPVNLNYSIADVRKPEERQQSFSKTISLPRSKTNDDILGYSFEINIDGSYNPKNRVSCKILANSIIQFDGYAQLKKIVTKNKEWVNYEIVVFGKLINMFTAIDKDELTDLDFSEYNHDYTKTNQANSWDTSIIKDSVAYVNFSGGNPTGEGYVYPLIDYGYSTNQIDYDVEQLYPAVYAKEYVDKIFTAAGYTYESTFFDSDYFKKLIIPFNRARLEFSASQIDTREMLSRTTGTTAWSSTITTSSTTAEPIQFPSEDYDTGNIHNPSATIGAYSPVSQVKIAAGTNGSYNIYANIFVQGTFTPDSGTVTSKGKIQVYGRLYKNNVQVSGSGSFCFIEPDGSWSGTYTTAASPSVGSAEYSNAYTGTTQNNPPNMIRIVANDLQLDALDSLSIRLVTKFVVDAGQTVTTTDYFLDGSSNDITGTLGMNILTNSFFQVQVNNTQVVEGNTIDMNQAIPENIKQKDFLVSIFRMFNLYADVKSLDEPTVYTIEPRDDFYASGKVDWSDRLDRLQELSITPMGLLDAGEYFYSYTQDKDFFNQKYEESWIEIYGQEEIDVENDFIKERKETKILFSPTPLADNGFSDIIIPRILNEDGQGNIVPYQGNIRILIYGGMRTADTAWNHIDNSGSTIRGDYPYSGHLDDPITPTEDLNFGIVREVYYNEPAGSTIVWTNSNLYNKYHKKFIDEVTDQNSRLVTAWMKLTPMDMYSLSFRKLYWFNNAYHRLHKIIDYNPSEYLLTQCEFLKVLGGTAFSSLTNDIDGAYDGNSDWVEPKLPRTKSAPDGNTLNTRNASLQVTGEDNRIHPTANDVKIFGDGNAVEANTERISVQGSNNVIEAGISDVNLINTDGVTVTESDVTYIDGVAVSGEDVVEDETRSFTTATETTQYNVDTTKGDVVAKLNSSDCKEGKVYRIKKTVNPNKVTISPGTGYTVEGESSLVIRKKDTNIPLLFDKDNSNWIII